LWTILPEEARDGEANHQILADDDGVGGKADFRVDGDAANSGAPGG
jgi:hypothetical protein